MLHPLQLKGAILDPLHGLIRFTDEEHSVLNHRLFRRLRNIKQNGLLHLIFPSATHTRLEHSLGTMYVADSILHALYFNSVAAKGLQRLETAAPGEAINFCDVSSDEVRAIFRITRLAALVHDLGHGPLSHTFDSFAPLVGPIRNLLTDNRLLPLAGLEATLSASESARVEHEVLSCIFFALIWNEIRDTNEPEVVRSVAAALLGGELIDLAPPKLRPWLPLIHDIVSSAPADADRMDYLERDSRSCGVSYGLYDRSRLMKTMVCYRGESEPDSFRLGMKLSGFRAVENFIQARFELFVQVYYHKTNRAIESMLGRISEAARMTGTIAVDATSLDSLASSYVELSDERFLDRLCDESAYPDLPTEARSLADDIRERRLWKRVHDYSSAQLGQQPELIDTRARAFRERLERACELSEELHVDRVKGRATKDLSHGAALLERGPQNGIYRVSIANNWEAISPIIRTLAAEEDSIVRLYIPSNDKRLAQQIRLKAFSLAAQEETADASGN